MAARTPFKFRSISEFQNLEIRKPFPENVRSRVSFQSSDRAHAARRRLRRRAVAAGKQNRRCALTAGFGAENEIHFFASREDEPKVSPPVASSSCEDGRRSRSP